MGYVSQNPSNRQTIIKSVYKKDNEDIIRNLSEGRRNPSSVVRESKNETAVPARLSALQQNPSFNIAPFKDNVKSELEELLEMLRQMWGR